MYKTILGVKGMVCPMCEAHVAGAIRENLGEDCSKVRANRKKECCEVLTEKPIPESDFRKALDGTGYEMTCFAQEEEKPKKGFFAKLFG